MHGVISITDATSNDKTVLHIHVVEFLSARVFYVKSLSSDVMLLVACFLSLLVLQKRHGEKKDTR